MMFVQHGIKSGILVGAIWSLLFNLWISSIGLYFNSAAFVKVFVCGLFIGVIPAMFAGGLTGSAIAKWIIWLYKLYPEPGSAKIRTALSLLPGLALLVFTCFGYPILSRVGLFPLLLISILFIYSLVITGFGKYMDWYAARLIQAGGQK